MEKRDVRLFFVFGCRRRRLYHGLLLLYVCLCENQSSTRIETKVVVVFLCDDGKTNNDTLFEWEEYILPRGGVERLQKDPTRKRKYN